ncbi:MAG: protein phosphatase 2C domain-containing protein, partial [Calditrichota bacterium]
SDIAVKAAYSYIKKQIDSADRSWDVSQSLAMALFHANEEVNKKALTNDNYSGMGSTLVELFISEGKAYFCHVGDSRAYLLRDGIHRLTKDQTLGDYLVEQKKTPTEQIPTWKWHALTQAIGGGDELVPEMVHLELKTSDTLLMCSDGLTDMLSDAEIANIIQKSSSDINKAANMLIQEANDKGGKDNISVILVSYP